MQQSPGKDMNNNFIAQLDDTSAIIQEENLYDSLFKQYERVVIESLITSFGLDALIEDRHGGDVDTIHTVREIGVDNKMKYKNDKNKSAYLERGEYDTKAYHSHPRFTRIKSGAHQKYNESGQLIEDAYTGQSLEYTKASAVPNDRRVELDHVVECKAIHDDRGRVLAGLSGIDLANDADNLAWTNKSLNASMGSWARHKNEKWKADHGCDAPSDAVGMEAYLREHPDIDLQTAARMRTQYAKSRKAYDAQVAKAYYTSPRFFKDAAAAAGKLSFKMGLRAALGLVFAELWFAARDEINKIEKYGAELFRAIGRGIKNGLANARAKYKELWQKFLSGAIGGAISSLVTTLTNIFFTTAKSTVRIIRQSWASLVEASKILFINPDCLRFGERIRATTKILATGASIVAGVMLSEAINSTAFGAIPFVGDIAATFCGTLLTGLMTCTLLFALDRSETINKIVSALDTLPTLENYIAYAKEQAHFLEELAAQVFSLDIEKFRRETEVITAAVVSIRPEMNDVSLIQSLQTVYQDLGFDKPWGNEVSFNSFITNKDRTLTFS